MKVFALAGRKMDAAVAVAINTKPVLSICRRSIGLLDVWGIEAHSQQQENEASLR
jgi:hypothetical protein